MITRMMAGIAGLVVATVFVVPPALAIEKCKVKINGKDGSVLVSASSVAGSISWSDDASTGANAFFNTPDCLVGGKAKNCRLGAPGTAAGITQPSLCTLFVSDAVNTCTAYIKGCVPGLRTTHVAFPVGNTRLGTEALAANTSGSTNTAVGNTALKDNTTGTDNTALGDAALRANTTGNRNTAIGERSLIFSNGSQNTAVGWAALNGNDTGADNVAVGVNALVGNSSGSNNIAIGTDAGSNLTGSNNIAIGNAGVAAESNAIRIGNANTASATNVTIQGIFGGGVNGSGVNVMIDNTGKTGVGFSSARFKHGIRNMGDSSSGILKLRPVTYRYNKDLDPTDLPQYGLIAEEVAEVYPDLVLWKDKQPLTVRYQFLVPMLLNELKKQHERQIAQAQKIRELQSQLGAVADAIHGHAVLSRANEELRARLLEVEEDVAHLTGDHDHRSLKVAAAGE